MGIGDWAQSPIPNSVSNFNNILIYINKFSFYMKLFYEKLNIKNLLKK